MKNSEFDSNEEMHFSWWLDQLVEAGFVKSYTLHPDPFLLSDSVPEHKIRKHIYTPDFKIEWKSCLECVSSDYIEIKPSFDSHNMTRLFTVNQKWVYAKYGIYVQKIVPEKLFKQTFIPDRFLRTDSGKQKRKIKFKYVRISEYLKEQQCGLPSV